MPRKELHQDCDGSIFCPVNGHVSQVTAGAFVRHSHIPLTAGQSRTLYERRAAQRAAAETEA